MNIIGGNKAGTMPLPQLEQLPIDRI